MDVFDNNLHEVCDQFDSMVIPGDFNLPDILWDSIDSASGVNELAFIESSNTSFELSWIMLSGSMKKKEVKLS